MLNIIYIFKKQNLGIKIGFITLFLSIFSLILGIILIFTAYFKTSPGISSQYEGNGFHAIYIWNINNFLTKSGYEQLIIDAKSDKLLTYPFIQVIIGIIFMIICTASFLGISIFSLIFGYFKRWLYS